VPLPETRTITVEVLRYQPDKAEAPYLEKFDVPFTDDMSVLQGLQYIKDQFDGSLTFRWSCRMAICGSCGVMIDGVPSLGCKTFMRDYYPKGFRVEALAHFPIERDLVVDATDFIEKLPRIEPWIEPTEEKKKTLAQGEYLQTPQQLEQFEQFSHCINCMLCYAACPQYGLNQEFLGPGLTALAHRYMADSRDGEHAGRDELLHSTEGVWNCTAVGYCSEVCPKHVDPANAVNQNKTKSALGWFARTIPGGRRHHG
jgi:fumarate reductase iron-sulfur subunit